MMIEINIETRPRDGSGSRFVSGMFEGTEEELIEKLRPWNIELDKSPGTGPLSTVYIVLSD